MEFANRLKELRTKKGLTQEQLAEILGVGRATIAGYETKGKQPDYEKLIVISNTFNVTIDYLLGKTDSSHPIKPTSIAAHFDGEMTKEQEERIREYAEFILNQRKDKND